MKLLITSLMAIFILVCKSQTIFQRTYDIGSGTEITKKIINVSGGYVMAGYSSSSSLQKDILIIQTNSTGNVVWSKTYSGVKDDEATDIISTYDGGFAVTGLTKSFATTGTDSVNAFIMKLDAVGNIIWSKAFGGNAHDAGNAILQTSDSGFVVTGYTESFGGGNKDVLIIKTNKNGNTTWMKAFGGSNPDVGNSICKSASNNYFLTGSTGITGSQNIILSLYINPSGNLIWHKTYDFTLSASNFQRIGFGALENNNKQFLITGKVGSGTFGDAQAFLLNIDSTGNSVNWARAYVLNSGDCSARSIQSLPDGGYVLGGSMGNYSPALIKVNSSGLRQWSYYYGSMNVPAIQGFGYSVAKAGDKGFALSGYYLPGSTNDTSAVIIKTDSLGNSSCNFANTFGSGTNTLTAIVSQISSTLTSGGTSFNISPSVISPVISPNTLCLTVGIGSTSKENPFIDIYPNPFNANTVIRFNEYLEDVEINLYDLLGKKLRTIGNISGNEYELSSEGLDAGVYFLILKHNNNSISKIKLVVSNY
ncbi:MAG: T9SS type A sorting domain-containing protein [Bacteroidetes bacterium]|nr:T9SS type A sorting domain-containing protein [Bacteroidota bacterium]